MPLRQVSLACGSRITSHSFVPCSSKSQRVVTPTAPHGLLVDFLGPVAGITLRATVSYIFATCGLLQNLSMLNSPWPFILSVRMPGVRIEQRRSSSFQCNQAIHTSYGLQSVRGPGIRVEQAPRPPCQRSSGQMPDG